MKHVLIIRLSAMGDAAMVSPVVEAFVADNPGVKVTVLTRPFFQAFFRNIEGVGFLDPDFKGRHKGLKGLMRLYREIKALDVTHIADMHDVLRTKVLRPLLWLNGCKVAKIDKGRKEKKALTRKFNKQFHPLTPTVERYVDVLRRLGFKFAEPVAPKHSPIALSEEILAVTGPKDGVWIGVAPFAQHKGKIYPIARMDELIVLLAAKYSRVFIFGGGEYEQEFAECMQERYDNVVSVIGKLKLVQELDLISNLDAMVTMDSSSMHMASLVGTPAVSVWGATHPYAGFYGFGQDAANAVQLDLDCRPCSVYGNKPCIYDDYRCLTRIAPQMIFERVESVVDSAR